MRSIAVAIIHGVGKTDLSFAEAMSAEVTDRFANELGLDAAAAEEALVIRPIYWAPVLTEPEDLLWGRMKAGGDLDFTSLRRFLIDFAADAIAYQPTPHDRTVYDDIHFIFADTIRELADVAGSEAPLCLVAHSLGSVIASNYLYDLQVDPRKKIISPRVRKNIRPTPLERGETLALLYTLGSPIAIWSLRYEDFGRPIEFPPRKLAAHYPELSDLAEWINFYDKDDIIGYPLKTLNERYRAVVTEDRLINAGSWLTSWNPASHLGYWEDDDITTPIAASLAKVWKRLNP